MSVYWQISKNKVILCSIALILKRTLICIYYRHNNRGLLAFHRANIREAKLIRGVLIWAGILTLILIFCLGVQSPIYRWFEKNQCFSSALFKLRFRSKHFITPNIRTTYASCTHHVRVMYASCTHHVRASKELIKRIDLLSFDACVDNWLRQIVYSFQGLYR